MSRAHAIAARIEAGARALADYAESLSDTAWQTPVHPDGRTAGVIVHHVASVYAIEVELARILTKGNPITDVTWAGIAVMNAQHAAKHSGVAKRETIALLRQAAASAASAVREFTDAELDGAAPISLYGNATLTAQFMLEDHAVRHSIHHLTRIRAAIDG